MKKVELLKKRNKWYWRLVANNGKVLAHSEQYSSKPKAEKTASKIFGDLNDSWVLITQITVKGVKVG